MHGIHGILRSAHGMRIDIITCLPGLLESPFAHSIIKRAIRQEKVVIQVHDLREYAVNKHRQIDDYMYGGGAGMLLMIEPIARCIDALRVTTQYQEIIYMAPDGEQLTQKLANELSLKESFIILCGHYKGVDERVRDHFVTREVSLGDYVLSGGELAAAVLVDTMVRLIPGVLSDETSALTDSYQDDLVAPPAYTRPAKFRNLEVPAVLLSGDAQKIQQWRDERAQERTKERRPLLHINTEDY